jgi:predicted acylesterase/phospholipase RssA
MQFGLVLSGGGARGDFQLGALRYVYDVVLPRHGMQAPDIICGTSVGSINAVKLAEGGREALTGLLHIWEGLRTNRDMHRTEDWYLRFEIELPGLLGGLAGSALLTGFTGLFGLLELGPQLLAIREIVEAGLNAVSTSNLSPIEAKLRDRSNLRPERVRASGIRLRMAAVELESGELRYVDEHGQMLGAGPVVPGDEDAGLVAGTLASASIPFVFPPVACAGGHYVDGGVRAVAPIQSAIDEGAEEVIAIVASQTGVTPTTYTGAHPLNVVNVAMRAATEIMPDQIQRSATEAPMGWGRRHPDGTTEPVPVTVVIPTVEVHDILTIDPGLIALSADYGYMRAYDAIDGAKLGDSAAEASRLSDRITLLRKLIWEREPQLHGQPYPDGSLSAAPLPADVHAMRQLKRDLAILVLTRRQLGGGMPEEFAHWWTDWEKHPWAFLVPSPWDEFSTVVGHVPAEAPPRTVQLTLVAEPPASGRVVGGGRYVSDSSHQVWAYPEVG